MLKFQLGPPAAGRRGNLVTPPVAVTNITISNASLVENAVAGTAIGTLSAVGGTGPFIFTLTDSSSNRAKLVSGTSIQAGSTPVNFESLTSFTISVHVVDANGQVFDKTLTITVSNVNETPNDIILSASTLPENSLEDFPIGVLTFLDPDAGDTGAFSLTDAASNRVKLFGNQIRAGSAAANFEAGTSFTIGVRFTDAGGLFRDETFTISVTNVNEAPTNITLSALTIAETSPEGTVIGTLSFVDPDAGATGTFTLVDNAGGRFKIVGNQLQAGAIATDWETATTHSITVRVTDQGPLFYNKIFTITVTDISEGSAPINTVAPTLVDTTPTIADVLNASTGISTGTWTGAPTPSYAKTYQLDYVTGAADVANFTIANLHAGYKLRGKVTALNSGGSTFAYTAYSSEVAGPSGTIFIKDYNPAIHYPVNNGSGPGPGPYFFYPIKNPLLAPRRYYLDSAYQAGQVTISNPMTAPNVIRFHVEAGQVMSVPGYFSDSASTNRNTITERGSDAYSPTADQFIEWENTVPAGAAFDMDWCSAMEMHVYGPSIAQKFETIIQADGRWATTSHYRTAGGVDTYRSYPDLGTWRAPSPLIRGHTYNFKLWHRSNVTAGQIIFHVDDVEVLRFTGPVGYAGTETSTRNQHGIYRGGAANALDVDFELKQHVIAPYNTLVFPAGPAPAYGANQLVAPFLNADLGSFADSGTEWVMTSGANIGPMNIPGLRKNLSGQSGKRLNLPGVTRRGTMSTSKVVVYTSGWIELGSFITTSTTDVPYELEFDVPVGDGVVYVYYGGEATASGQTVYHKKPSTTQIREVL